MKKIILYCLIMTVTSSCTKNEGSHSDPNGRPNAANTLQGSNSEIRSEGDRGPLIDPNGRTKAANTQHGTNGEITSEGERGILIDPNGRQ